MPQFDVWFGEHIDRVTSTVYFSLVIDEQMETQLLGLWKTLIIHSKRAVFGSLHLLANWINALRVPAILDLRNAPAIEKGAKLPACLALVPDDQGTSVMLDRDTGSAGFLLGCQAIGIMCAAYPPKMLATALELFRQVFECPNPAAPSQVTALIAATVIGTIGSVAPRATTRAALPPQVLSLMEAFLRRQVAVPCGECNLQLRTAAACAMCFTYWSPPEHLSEVINVMMTLLKHDKYRGFQECAATGLATMAAKTLARTPSPVPKLVRIVAATLAAPLVGECTSRTKLERRGGVKALTCIAKIMKDGLFERIPKLWKLMSDPLIFPPSPSSLSSSMSSLSSSLSSAQPDHAYRCLREDDPGYSAVITALCLFSVLLPCVHPSLKPKVKPNNQ